MEAMIDFAVEQSNHTKLQSNFFPFFQYDYSHEVVTQEWGVEVYPGRKNWASHTDYVMAVIGLILGVSSYSFFPFVCLKYGKGYYKFTISNSGQTWMDLLQFLFIWFYLFKKLVEFLYKKLFGANILISVLFLIPYAVSMVLVAMPMMLLEIALGQYTSNSTLTCWKMAPIFKGIVNIWAFMHSKYHL